MNEKIVWKGHKSRHEELMTSTRGSSKNRWRTCNNKKGSSW